MLFPKIFGGTAAKTELLPPSLHLTAVLIGSSCNRREGEHATDGFWIKLIFEI
jgi:hypothetical protein